MIVDVNMHHLPQKLFSDKKILNAFLNSAPRGFGEIASLGTADSGAAQLVLEKPAGHPNLNYVDGDYSLDAKLRAMDEAGVDVGLLRVPVWQEWLDLETCKVVNDEAAAMCKESGGRLFANAVVPPWGGEENLAEVKRCLDLGMVGVQVACHYGQLYLDDLAFRPYLTALNELSVPVIVHHTPLPVQWQSIIDYTNLRRELGRIIDQMTAVGRELCSGMFEELPNLKFVHTMFGGNWFGVQDLIAPKRGPKKESLARFDVSEGQRIAGYLRDHIYFDMTHPASWGKEQVECAIRVNGADRVLFGTSFPVSYNWMKQGVDFMKTLDIPEADRELITSGNAKKLFGLPI